MRKYCIVGEIKPESVDQYVKKHKEIHNSEFRGILDVIKKTGVKNEVIFMYKNLAIIYFEAEDLNACYKFHEDFNAVKKWNKIMEPMFESKYDFGGDVSMLSSLRKIFDLNEQLECRLNN
jgi:L-rhamnose mutarotase